MDYVYLSFRSVLASLIPHGCTLLLGRTSLPGPRLFLRPALLSVECSYLLTPIPEDFREIHGWCVMARGKLQLVLQSGFAGADVLVSLMFLCAWG